MCIIIILCKCFKINNFHRNLLIPSGFKMASSHLAKYSIKLYRAEMLRFLFETGVKWLSIDFGEAPEVTHQHKILI